MKTLLFALLFTTNVLAQNVFNCSSAYPQFNANTIYIPLMMTEFGVWKEVFIRLEPGEAFNEGTYSILVSSSLPEFKSCSGFTRSAECPGLEALMCN